MRTKNDTLESKLKLQIIGDGLWEVLGSVHASTYGWCTCKHQRF